MPPIDPIPLDDVPLLHRMVLVMQQVVTALNGNTTTVENIAETVRQVTHALTRDADSRDAWRVWLTTSLEGRAALIFVLTSLFGPGFLEVVQMVTRGPL